MKIYMSSVVDSVCRLAGVWQVPIQDRQIWPQRLQVKAWSGWMQGLCGSSSFCSCLHVLVSSKEETAWCILCLQASWSAAIDSPLVVVVVLHNTIWYDMVLYMCVCVCVCVCVYYHVWLRKYADKCHLQHQVASLVRHYCCGGGGHLLDGKCTINQKWS